MPPTVEAWSLNQWAARLSPHLSVLNRAVLTCQSQTLSLYLPPTCPP